MTPETGGRASRTSGVSTGELVGQSVGNILYADELSIFNYEATGAIQSLQEGERPVDDVESPRQERLFGEHIGEAIQTVKNFRSRK